MRLRIFLVEDNPLILHWLAEALEELSRAQVIGSAATEAEACDWLAAHNGAWDVAVVDLWLAEGNGVEVIKCLRKTPEQRVVVLTNYPTEMLRRICTSAGADAFFDKSTELDEFTGYIAQIGADAAGPAQH